MPVAEKFSFLGPYTGFRGCFDKIDVSDAYLVAPQTLAEVSKMYWSIYKMSATASITAAGLLVEDVISETTPRNRICDGYSLTKEDPETPSFYATMLKIDTSLQIAKLYNGNVNLESNLIGYGFSDGNGEVGEGDTYALAGAWDDGGDGRVGTTDILTTVCQYSPTDTSPEAVGWWRQFSILGNNFTGTLTAAIETIGGLQLIRLRWTTPAGYQADITDLEFYTY